MEVTRKEIKEVLLLDAGFPILHNPDPYYFQSVQRVKGRLHGWTIIVWIDPQSGYVELPARCPSLTNIMSIFFPSLNLDKENHKKFYKINLFELVLYARRVSYKNMWILKSNNFFEMDIFSHEKYNLDKNYTWSMFMLLPYLLTLFMFTRTLSPRQETVVWRSFKDGSLGTFFAWVFRIQIELSSKHIFHILLWEIFFCYDYFKPVHFAL